MALPENGETDHRDSRIVNANLSDSVVPSTPMYPSSPTRRRQGSWRVSLGRCPGSHRNAVYHVPGKRIRDLHIAIKKML